MFVHPSQKNKAYIAFATISIVMFITYQHTIGIHDAYTVDFEEKMQNSKYLKMPMAGSEITEVKKPQKVKKKPKKTVDDPPTLNWNNITDHCDFSWREDKFDPQVYEAKDLDYDDLHEIKPRKITHPVPVISNPVHKLDPDRFIIPLLEGGPNNQIFCMRETMLIAIKMNRTLVVPKFKKHFTDSQREKQAYYIFPGHRVNLVDLCSLLSCITIDQFQETCNNKPDQLLTFSTNPTSNIKRLELYAGMRMTKENGKLNMPLLPDRSRMPPTTSKIASDEIEEYYQSKERCLLYRHPLLNLKISTGIRKGKYRFVPSNRPDYARMNSTDCKVMMEITKSTQAPKYIKNIAQNFIKFLIKNKPFATVHWRYNRGDYFTRCDKRIRRKGSDKFCELASSRTAEDLADEIVKKIEQKKADEDKFPMLSKVEKFYIATPLTEMEMVKNISKVLLKKKGWKLYTSVELQEYVIAKYTCEVTKKHFNDILSTLEMEICTRGVVFLKSHHSTWSQNVALSRLISPREGTYPTLDEDIIEKIK